MLTIRDVRFDPSPNGTVCLVGDLCFGAWWSAGAVGTVNEEGHDPHDDNVPDSAWVVDGNKAEWRQRCQAAALGISWEDVERSREAALLDADCRLRGVAGVWLMEVWPDDPRRDPRNNPAPAELVGCVEIITGRPRPAENVNRARCRAELRRWAVLQGIKTA